MGQEQAHILTQINDELQTVPSSPLLIHTIQNTSTPEPFLKLCHVYVPEWRPRQQCFFPGREEVKVLGVEAF